MKKFFLLFLVVFIILTPFFSRAENDSDLERDSYIVEIIDEEGKPTETIEVEYDGMVSCGRCLTVIGEGGYSEFLDDIHECEDGETFIPCDFCHLFIVFDRIINFFLFVLIPLLALMAIVFSGVTMMFVAKNPEMINKAKKIFLYAILGLFLSYLAWAITSLAVFQFMDTEKWELGWTGMEARRICPLQISEDPHAEEDNNGTNSEPEDEDENDEDDPDPDKHTLRIEVQGEVGDSLTIPEPGESHEYEAEKDINIHAYPEPGYAFDGWGGDIATTDESVEITMDQDYEITATFRSVEPETILNKATGKSCNEVCLEEGMNCVSIGTNDSADSGDFWYRGTFPNITCYDDGEGSCSTDMDSYTISRNCEGYEADWTRCRCE